MFGVDTLTFTNRQLLPATRGRNGLSFVAILCVLLLLYRVIVRRRRNLEYRLLRRPAKKEDFLRAIQVVFAVVL